MDPSGDSLAAPNQQDFRHNEGSRGDDGNNLTELGAGQRLSRPSSTRPSLSGASSPGSPPPAGAAPPNHGERPPSGSLSLSESTPSLLQPSDDSSRHEGSRFDLDSLNHSPASTAATSGVNAAGKGDVNRQPGDFLDLAQSEVARDAQAQHDINARIERKRQEHERQRAMQRKVFEQQMLLLEMQQREEEQNLLKQQSPKDQNGGNPAASAPSTPPHDGSHSRSGYSNSLQVSAASSPQVLHPGAASGLSSSISGLRPEEGLNGSNVPGLAFAHNNTNARSVPASRRTSGDDSADGQATGNLLGNHQQRQQQQQSQQAQRRSAADLVGAFNRMGLGPRGVSQLRAQLTESAGNSPGQPGNRGPLGNLSTSQQSALQRVLARSGSEPQNMAQQGAAGAANGAAGNNAGQPGEGFTPVFSERFLFDDELDAEDSAFVKKYVNMQEDDDKFPILVRRDSFPGMLSASSAALDLAPLSQTPPRFSRGHAGDGSKLSEWPQFAGRNSDAGVAGQGASEGHGNEAFADRRGRSERSSPRFGPVQGPGANRQSTFPLPSPSPRVPQTGRASPAISGSQGPARHTAPGTPAPGNGAEGHRGPPARFTSQGPHQLAGLSHNHFGNKTGNDEHHGPPGLPKGLSHPDLASVQQSAATGGSYRNAVPDGRRSGAGMRDSTFPSFGMDAFNDRTVLPPANGQKSVGTPGRFTPYSPSGFDGSGAHGRSRPSSGYFDAFGATAGSPQPHNVFGAGSVGSKYGLGIVDPPTPGKLAAGAPGAASKQARKGDLDAATRLEELQGEIFALCKDQHGCRYLQKKLEEGVPSYRDMIFAETFSHFAELMTDPFGNYLCQKMLEYCTDDQRNLIVESVAPELVGISLNMHGTRAVQKTIDFLSTSRQIHSIIVALSMNVVTLIKDLNGNHVIQKCLNRLSAEDNQFIYNAVAAHCVEVATHRHGCCVLQRCIDHASDSQRIQLVTEITFNALTLVQDPFGNYVVQYVLDLNDPRFSDAVIRQFIGNVCLLSVQKFSSNVIEKCIRVSETSTRKHLIDELLNRARLEKLLRDSFANYVVQTSLDYAEPIQRMQLVECIRPILPMIRNTPYGKRIQSKLQRDNLDMAPPNNMSFTLLQAAHHQQLQAMAAMANRQTSTDFAGMNPYSAAAHGALHQQPGSQHQPHMPPPHQMFAQQNNAQHHSHGQGPPHLGGGGLANYQNYGVNSFNGGGLPPMGMHGHGYPNNLNAGFPY